jgi:hypothetical protein
MKSYYVSISFSDVPGNQVDELLNKVQKLRTEYSLTVFEEEDEEINEVQ